MAGWTNRGKFTLLDIVFRNATEPTVFYVALVTSATAPNADINTLSQLTEIAAGNGYTAGGISIARDATDFDVLTEDDAGDKALIQIKDTVWTASGGPIPGSGDGARHAVLLDDNVTVGSRIVLAFWSLGSDRTVSDGQTLTLQDLELQGTE